MCGYNAKRSDYSQRTFQINLLERNHFPSQGKNPLRKREWFTCNWRSCLFLSRNKSSELISLFPISCERDNHGNHNQLLRNSLLFSELPYNFMNLLIIWQVIIFISWFLFRPNSQKLSVRSWELVISLRFYPYNLILL